MRLSFTDISKLPVSSEYFPLYLLSICIQFPVVSRTFYSSFLEESRLSSWVSLLTLISFCTEHCRVNARVFWQERFLPVSLRSYRDVFESPPFVVPGVLTFFAALACLKANCSLLKEKSEFNDIQLVRSSLSCFAKLTASSMHFYRHELW